MVSKILKFGNLKESSTLSPAHGKGGARATILFLSAPPPEKIAGGFQQAGKKEGGLGEGIFARLLSAEGGMGWESVSAILPLAEYQNRKIFVSLIEKILGRARLKNVEKIFLFCSPKRSGGGRKRWASQSAESSGFCWKKVLTSSSKHHHIELDKAAASPLRGSADRFARNCQGFLKSIESFCSLIWRFANLKSLPCFEKQKPIFLFRLWRKAKRDFIKLSV